jgi:BA14K-like protein
MAGLAACNVRFQGADTVAEPTKDRPMRQQNPHANPRQGVRILCLISALSVLVVPASSPALALSPSIGAPVAPFQSAVPVRSRDVFHQNSDGVYLNGVRGHHRWRKGYRRSNGFWFPTAAFFGSVIIGSALANAANSGNASRHVRWCDDRYRSYRIRDNTFQPYIGPRRGCNSPYN